MNRKIELQNIGKHTNSQYDLSEGQMFAFIGKNSIGKSTVVRAMETIFGVKGFMAKPVKDGEDEGAIIYEGEDKNGDPIKIEWTVEKDKTAGKFKAMVSLDGKVKNISAINKIQELIGVYTPINAQQAMDMMKTAADRKKFIEKFIFPCMGEDARERLNEIDVLISDSKKKECEGNLFHQRTEAKKEHEMAYNVMETLSVKDKNGNILTVERIDKAIEAMREKQKGLINTLNANKAIYEKNKKLHDVALDFSISLEELDDKEEYTKLKEMLTPILELPREDPEANRLTEELEGIKSRIVTAESTKKNVERYEDSVKIKNKKFEEIKELDKEIQDLRDEKSEIIKNSNLPSGLEFNDEEIIFNGMPFDASVVSETEAQIAMIELMLEISTSPLINIGDWSLYDNDSKKKIRKLVSDSKRILIGQMVTEDDEVNCEVIMK